MTEGPKRRRTPDGTLSPADLVKALTLKRDGQLPARPSKPQGFLSYIFQPAPKEQGEVDEPLGVEYPKQPDNNKTPGASYGKKGESAKYTLDTDASGPAGGGTDGEELVSFGSEEGGGPIGGGAEGPEKGAFGSEKITDS